MKIGVKVLPKNEVLDVQGRAVENTLKAHQWEVNQCRVGKYIQLDIPENDEAPENPQRKNPSLVPCKRSSMHIQRHSSETGHLPQIRSLHQTAPQMGGRESWF